MQAFAILLVSNMASVMPVRAICSHLGQAYSMLQDLLCACKPQLRFKSVLCNASLTLELCLAKHSNIKL